MWRTVADMPRKITTQTSAEVFRVKRIEAGLSVHELADLSGIQAKTLYQIEAGNHQHPRMSTVRAVAEALGIPHTELLVDEVA